jgi:hypothetical protein
MSQSESVAREELLSTIEEIQSNKELLSLNEADIKRSVVLRILHQLKWNAFNVHEVFAEFPIGNDKLDYALIDRKTNEVMVFIEAKRGGEELNPQHQNQLLKYSFQKSVRLAILTNGTSWQFFLPMEAGDWNERIFDTIDFKSSTPDTIATQFIDYLWKEKVISGDAIKLAKARFENGRVKIYLPKVWNRLMVEPNEALITLIQKETQDKHGVFPSGDDVKQFLAARKPEPNRPTPPAVICPPTDQKGGKGWWGRVTVEDDKGGVHLYNSMADCRTRMGLNTDWDKDMFQAFEEVGFEVVLRPSQRDGSGVKLKAPVGWPRF